MIEMNCPHCGHQLRIDDKFQGQRGACKHCQCTIEVPRFSQPQEANAPGSNLYEAVDLNTLNIDPDKPFPQTSAPMPKLDASSDSLSLWLPRAAWILLISAYFAICMGVPASPFLTASVLLLSLCVAVFSSKRGAHVFEAIVLFIAMLVFWPIVGPVYLLRAKALDEGQPFSGGRTVATGCGAFLLISFLFAVGFGVAVKNSERFGRETNNTSNGNPQSFTQALDNLQKALPNDKDIKITLAEFNRIQNGMTYEQVVAIVGDPGVVQSENLIGADTQFETHTIMYGWQNSDISGANAMFQNGALMQKSQFALK